VALAAPSTGSSLLAIADAAAGLELLDTNNLAPARLIPIRGGAAAVAVSPDGRTAAIGTHNGSVGFVDTRTGRVLGALAPSHVYAVRDLAFSPDGRWLASTDGSVVYLWRARARRPTAAFPSIAGAATSLSFNPSGQSLVLAENRSDGSGAMDELTLPRLRLVRQHIVEPVVQTAFSGDGRILFSADRAGRMRLLDARTLQPGGAPLPANASHFAVGPSEALLATSTAAGAVQLWDLPSGRPILTLLAAGGAPVQLAFEARGDALVTLADDGTGTLWDVRHKSWEQRACDIAGRPLTAQEWRDALPGLTYSPACMPRARQ
jgi:WD40 repeat protein